MNMPNDFFERTLEEIIITNRELVQQKGFPYLYSNTINQFRLPSGKICDIVSYEIGDNALYCKIFELKRAELGIASLSQVIEYGREFAEYSVWSFDRVNIDLFVVGADIGYDLLNMSMWGVNVNVLTYDYRVDGIYFESLTKNISASPLFLSVPHELFTKPSPDAIKAFKDKLLKQL